ncbi:MAG: class I SAM-dependent RNA methyltransferase [Actinomycetota bacterium]
MRHRRSPSRKPRAAAPPPRTLELDIEQVGARGDGLARVGDDLVFVPFTVAGDRVLARVEGRRGDGLAAALIEVLRPGPGRADPPCPHFGRCGGCAVQHMADDLYGAWKGQLLVTQLARQGLAELAVEPLVRVPPASRRRAAFAFVRRRGQCLLGFNARASHAVVDLEHCPLLEPALTAALPPLRALLAGLVADGEEGDVIATLTEGGLDLLVEAEARLDLFDRERLAAFADAHDLARLSWRRPGVGFAEPIARRRAALVRFADIAVEPPPGAFLQPTRGGELAIAERITTALEPALAAGGPVLDLFAGCGSFTFALARRAAVHAVEGEQEPLAALDAAARLAGLEVSTEVRDLARRPLLATELKKYRAVVFDPPRAGAGAQAEQLAAGGPPLVVAVSCNPATLARDLRTLVDGGYRCRSVTPIDQFPWSAHLEAVAVLSR